jgi:hypothetical protein
VKNVARNSRITNPSATVSPALLTSMRSFLKLMCNPMVKGTPAFDDCTRPWLYDKFLRCSVNTNYQCDIDTEPVWNLVKMLEVVGRDLKKIPISDDAGPAHVDEVLAAFFLIAVSDNRDYGIHPYYGGVSGSNVTIP